MQVCELGLLKDKTNSLMSSFYKCVLISYGYNYINDTMQYSNDEVDT